MLSLPRLFLGLILFFSIEGQTQLGPYFYPATLAREIQKTLSLSNTAADFHWTLEEINERRAQWNREFLPSFFKYYRRPNQSLIDRAIRYPILMVAFPVMLKYQVLHSLPLVSHSPQDPNLDFEKTLTYFIVHRQSELRKHLDHDINHLQNQELTEALMQRTKLVQKGFSVYAINPNLQSIINNFYLIAEPLVKWLVQQPYQSVQHVELFKKSVELYTDPLLSLGVIGQLFDLERRFCSFKRTSNCFLGHRLRPLFAKSTDAIGTNYHFWATLNLGLSVSYSEFMDVGSLIIEKLKQKDSEDFSADLLGLKVGRAVRQATIK